jgi:protein SCO1/2
MISSIAHILARAPFARRAAAGMALAVVAVVAPSPAAAQPMAPARVVSEVGIDQKLDQQLPLDLTFRDESGKTVKLGDYFGKKPVLLSLVYYECPGLCTMTLNGMASSFKPMDFTVGKEFDVVTVSFDPTEKPELAAAKKAQYVKQYGRPEAERGWHFLTGDEAEIKQLTRAAGFRYVYDVNTKQYAHGAAIMLTTPQGKLSRYFYGLEYSTRDLRLGLVEASEDRIGTVADAVTLLCYQYDPKSGKYGWAVMRTIQAGAIVTMLSLGTFMFVMFRRERHAGTTSGGSGEDGPAAA